MGEPRGELGDELGRACWDTSGREFLRRPHLGTWPPASETSPSAEFKVTVFLEFGSGLPVSRQHVRHDASSWSSRRHDDMVYGRHASIALF
jgi:hypothetical protein